uniref:Rab-GAP TBC domain-containing protein n=1 Tax=Aureoumbra lagunensis TaxID=44058 RepID=A0A7S3NPE7_9STRA
MEERYEVLVSEPGPLYMRLEAPNLKIKSWDPTPHGGPGPIEVIGRVRIGDTLVGIGETRLDSMDFQACVTLIKHAPRPCIFHFSRIKKGAQLFNSMDELKKSANDGLVATKRALVWRILLKYLPIEESQWSEKLVNQRKLYAQFLQEFFAESDVFNGGQDKENISCGGLIEDAELMNEIQKDIIRTQPNIEFFVSNEHQAAMKRILFIYAKLNPGVRYVQGMNEVLGVLYYVFANSLAIDKPEADAFFCFTNLMSELRDLYIHSLDHSDTGLLGHISKLNDLLQQIDPELWTHLYLVNQLNPSHYALRWMTTLLTREFSLPQTLRLWDSLFASVSRTDFLIFFSLAMLRAQRDALLQGDFSLCLSLLQNYPPTDPNYLLQVSNSLRQTYLSSSGSGTSSSRFVSLLNTNNNLLASGSSWLLRKFTPSATGSSQSSVQLSTPPKKSSTSSSSSGNRSSNFFLNNLNGLPSFSTSFHSTTTTIPNSSN